ncbi:restriction system protein [Sphingopyxis italica]|uniref:Restriction system protein n=1 Tax=Sphingopyxis italica TaxID=1129133 RepID=A0A7X5XPK2_9SPHN|nr:restriction endonuclease [Sphingopyxis italica]NJB88943.1 restriction system protein [Sphingopyxis italica]
MTVDDLPKYHEFFRPTLIALDGLGGSASLAESNDAVMTTMALNPAMLDVEYSSGHGAVLPDRMSWARSYLKGAGYLKSGGRGIWILTDEGREAVSMTASQLKTDVLAKNKEVEKSAAAGDDTPSTPQIGNPEAEFLDWKDQLLTKLKSLDPSAFERLSQRLLRESGFVKVEVTGKSGDGGIDGTGILQLSLMSFHVLFQCKRYQGSVGAGAVRDFRGAMMGRTDKGLIITTGTFSPDARREATRDGAPPIDLIDGEALCEKLKELGLGVETRMVEEVVVKPDWFGQL